MWPFARMVDDQQNRIWKNNIFGASTVYADGLVLKMLNTIDLFTNKMVLEPSINPHLGKYIESVSAEESLGIQSSDELWWLD